MTVDLLSQSNFLTSQMITDKTTLIKIMVVIGK